MENYTKEVLALDESSCKYLAIVRNSDGDIVYKKCFDNEVEANRAAAVYIVDRYKIKYVTFTPYKRVWEVCLYIGNNKYYVGTYDNKLHAVIAKQRFIKRHKLRIDCDDLEVLDLRGDLVLDSCMNRKDYTIYNNVVSPKSRNIWMMTVPKKLKEKLGVTSISFDTEKEAALALDLLLDKTSVFIMYNQDIDPTLYSPELEAKVLQKLETKLPELFHKKKTSSKELELELIEVVQLSKELLARQEELLALLSKGE